MSPTRKFREQLPPSRERRPGTLTRAHLFLNPLFPGAYQNEKVRRGAPACGLPLRYSFIDRVHGVSWLINWSRPPSRTRFARLPALRRPAPGRLLKTIADSHPASSRCAKGDYLFHEGEPSHGFLCACRKARSTCHRDQSQRARSRSSKSSRAGESFAEAAVATLTGYPADAPGGRALPGAPRAGKPASWPCSSASRSSPCACSAP